MQEQEPSKGFLFVASNKKRFYDLAINAMESLKDFYPEAKICFVTEKYFCDGREKVADHLIYCGSDIREKLWALSKTPFDITMYIDADVEIIHEDISTAFDYLQDNDMVFVELTEDKEDAFAIRHWPGGEMKMCRGVVLYDLRNPLVKEFVMDWDYYYYLQSRKQWAPDYNEDGTPNYDLHPETLFQFDQFTLWWLIEKNPKYKDLKCGFFEEGDRWNWYMYYEVKGHPKPSKPIIIQHYSGLPGVKNDK